MSNLFRDLVEGDCSEPNAVGGFVQQFTSDKTGLYNDKLEHSHFLENELFRMNAQDDRFEERHLDKIFNGEQNDNVHDLLDRNFDQYQQGPQQHHGQLNASQVETDVQFLFQDFIMSTKSRHIMQHPPIHIPNLSQSDKVKIKNRSQVMFKHIAEQDVDQGYTNEQLNTLFSLFDIDPELEDFDSQWDKQWDQTHANEWIDDFQRNHNTTTTTTTTGGYMYNSEIPKDYIEDEEQNYEYAWRQEEEEDEYDQIFDEDENFNPFESAWKNTEGVEFEDHSIDAAWDETARKSIQDVTRPITDIQDPKIKNSNFYKLMSQLNTGEAVIDKEKEELVFNETVIPQELHNRPIDNEGVWEREYQDFEDEVSLERLNEYQFTIDEARDEDTFDRGMQLFNEGLIDDSIIALESEVKRSPENSQAWMYLGIAHAENDKDQQAIKCLLKCIQLDPNNLSARISLAVSYTNDYQKERALDSLHEWMKRNPQYQNIANQFQETFNQLEIEESNYMDTWKKHNIITDMFLDAARMRPNDPDGEVQTILGLLFNMSYDYDKAVDCFKAALQNKPTDYQLWNKLGATLANSNKCQEALGAYFKALEHKPSYVRARSNLGIAYLSLNMFHEAAQNFLGAISIHPDAVHIWDNLKMVFRLMGREDLIQKSETRDVSLFVKDFNFM
ncbi:tetratricopeptide-like helical domain-containing protein (TPR) [Tieghemostelium lacteum]|uniref:Tetratricopeptide-like helical domain-containing protein (TPR) n=1 Tax=Tieghemostelium lacteum TaxID=361077 RepID=A0A151Z8T7_TIELA|nr:tetratricopeptide-like helical domain-containing protein (TPR) [Tieghemostelium lacteum]|eukprot:KYQ90341.1 tetratricopeptide-like helical domain-containing protein (TPR) [Tieghemostelium lacteum]